MAHHLPLQPGERAPDFLRPTGDGRVEGFYERWCGRPLLLAIALRPDLPEVAQLLAALSARLDGRAGDVGLVVLVPAGRLPPADTAPGMVFVQDDGRVTAALLGSVPGEREVPVFLFDACLRLVARLPADAGNDALDAALATLRAPETALAPAGLAPVLTVPGVLDLDLCRRLIDAWQGGHVESGMPRMRDGKPVLLPDASAKKRRDHVLTDPALNDAVVTALQRRLLPEIAKAFAFPVQRYEAFKVVAYDAADGGWFRPHRDNHTPDAAHRRFAMTLALNDGYAGGGLRFPEYGPAMYRPPAGVAIVFACAHLHELTDVTAGRRFALLTFFS